jgi:hypothetical protein
LQNLSRGRPVAGTAINFTQLKRMGMSRSSVTLPWIPAFFLEALTDIAEATPSSTAKIYQAALFLLDECCHRLP